MFGSIISLINLDNETERLFQIVGEYEADPKLGKISYKSPLGRATLGLEEGDEFTVETPKGETVWEIISISK